MKLRKAPIEVQEQFYLTGGMPIITQKTFRLLLEFLGQVVRTIERYGWLPPLQKRAGQAYLEYVSDSLLDIRENSNEKKEVYLRSYAFLRDQKDKIWSDPKSTEPLWQLILPHLGMLRLPNSTTSDGAEQETQSELSQPSSSSGKGSCGHCGSSTFHAKVRPPIGNGSANYPFKEETQKVAKKVTEGMEPESPLSTIGNLVNKIHRLESHLSMIRLIILYKTIPVKLNSTHK